jgi:hypothetical protein
LFYSKIKKEKKKITIKQNPHVNIYNGRVVAANIGTLWCLRERERERERDTGSSLTTTSKALVFWFSILKMHANERAFVLNLQTKGTVCS